MQLVELKEVKIFEPKKSKTGGLYHQVAIRIDDEEELRYGFGNYFTDQWKVGDKVELELFEEEYKDKVYKKFKYDKFLSLQDVLGIGDHIIEVDRHIDKETGSQKITQSKKAKALGYWYKTTLKGKYAVYFCVWGEDKRHILDQGICQVRIMIKEKDGNQQGVMKDGKFIPELITFYNEVKQKKEKELKGDDLVDAAKEVMSTDELPEIPEIKHESDVTPDDLPF